MHVRISINLVVTVDNPMRYAVPPNVEAPVVSPSLRPDIDGGGEVDRPQ